MLVSSSHTPNHDPVAYQIELDGDTVVNGMSALKMYETYKNGARKLFSIIRTEREKVYFQSYNGSTDWTLLYDFGLKEGEGCYVGTIDTHWTIKEAPIITYVKCIGITADEQYEGMETMTMIEYINPEEDGVQTTGTWIKGLGSPRGCTANNYFDVVGRSSQLIIAVCPASGVSYPKDLSSADVITKDANVQNIDTSKSLTIYSIDGKILRHIPNPPEYEKITFEDKGVYIIKNGNNVRKIIIR